MVRLVLQRAFGSARGGFQVPCPVCLGPSKHGRGVLLLEGDEPLPRCPAWGKAVDQQGRSAGYLDRGQLVLKVIRLHDGPAYQPRSFEGQPAPLTDPT